MSFNDQTGSVDLEGWRMTFTNTPMYAPALSTYHVGYRDADSCVILTTSFAKTIAFERVNSSNTDL